MDSLGLLGEKPITPRPPSVGPDPKAGPLAEPGVAPVAEPGVELPEPGMGFPLASVVGAADEPVADGSVVEPDVVLDGVEELKRLELLPGAAPEFETWLAGENFERLRFEAHHPERLLPA